MRRTPLTPTLLLGLLFLPYCDRPNGTGSEGELERLVGVVDQRIGTMDGELTFATVIRVRKGPDGRIYSGEFGRSDIRIFTREGEPDGVIGRAGEGPGEFGGPVTFGWIDGRLWTWDQRLGRLSWFEADGSLAETLQPARFQHGDDPLPFTPGTPLPGGTFLTSQSIPSQMVTDGQITSTPTLRATVEGEVLDTLWVRDLRNQTLGVMSGTGGFFTSQPFAQAPAYIAATDAEQIVIVDWTHTPSPLIRVTRRSFAGDTLLSADFPFSPRAVVPEEVAAQVRLAESPRE